MIDYKLIKEIQKNPSHTQRSLAKKLNVSLGKINYVLTGLVEKGLIKAKKLTSETGKIRWNYVLTPKGIKDKIEIARNYLGVRMREFDELQKEISELNEDVEKSPSGTEK